MPHVIVKLWPGNSYDQKQRLTPTEVEQARQSFEAYSDADAAWLLKLVGDFLRR